VDSPRGRSAIFSFPWKSVRFRLRGSWAAKSRAAGLSLSVASTGVPSIVMRMFMAVDLSGDVLGAGLVAVRSGVLGDADGGES
jgi:hypothetical protein